MTAAPLDSANTRSILRFFVGNISNFSNMAPARKRRARFPIAAGRRVVAQKDDAAILDHPPSAGKPNGKVFPSVMAGRPRLPWPISHHVVAGFPTEPQPRDRRTPEHVRGRDSRGAMMSTVVITLL